ncbi:MAG: hypothetical protein HYR78_06975 [Nitrospirae bacterium]|nr:hypothetical protein [Nitrospirota bacterium]
MLDGIPGISKYYVTLTSNYDLSDHVKIYVSVNNGSCSPESISAQLQASLRVSPEVVIMSEEQVMEQVYSGNSRKLIRLIDRRQTNGEL